MKQTVYLNNFGRKSGLRFQFLRQSVFQTHHCWRGLMTSPIKCSVKLNPLPYGRTLETSLTLSQTKQTTRLPNSKSLQTTILDLIEMTVKFPKRVENTVGKGEIARYEQFLLVFKRAVLQTRKNQGLFG